MNRPAKFLLIVLFFLCGSNSNGQVLGIWEGNFGEAEGMIHPLKIILELYKGPGSSITGATHIYYRNNKYEHYKVNGVFNEQDGTYAISEDSVLSVKLNFLSTAYTGTYRLKLNCQDTTCSLIGKWKTHKRIFFEYKTVDVWFKKNISKPIVIPEQPKADVPAPVKKSVVLERHSDIQSLIEVDPKKTDSIKIEIYDNGIVDNDSISLYMDDSLLLTKQVISVNPITLSFPVDRIKAISKLRLIAESLGSTPPCTALMIIRLNKKRYEVNLSSNFDKNAVVEFFLKE